MVNRLKGEASFTIGDETFTLVYDAEALLSIEDALGIGLAELFEQLSAAQQDPRKVRMGTLCTILACGLATHHPGTTRGEAFDLLTNDFPTVEAALSRSLGDSMPQGDGRGAGAASANPPPAAKAARNRASPAVTGTGKTSTQAGANRVSAAQTSGKRHRG